MVKEHVDDLVSERGARHIDWQPPHMREGELSRAISEKLFNHVVVFIVGGPVSGGHLCVFCCIPGFGAVLQKTLNDFEAVVFSVLLLTLRKEAAEAGGHKRREAKLVLLVD